MKSKPVQYYTTYPFFLRTYHWNKPDHFQSNKLFASYFTTKVKNVIELCLIITGIGFLFLIGFYMFFVQLAKFGW